MTKYLKRADIQSQIDQIQLETGVPPNKSDLHDAVFIPLATSEMNLSPMTDQNWSYHTTQLGITVVNGATPRFDIRPLYIYYHLQLGGTIDDGTTPSYPYNYHLYHRRTVINGVAPIQLSRVFGTHRYQQCLPNSIIICIMDAPSSMVPPQFSYHSYLGHHKFQHLPSLYTENEFPN